LAGTPTAIPPTGTVFPFVTTLPAPTTAFFPILTGAIRTESDPINAPSSILVILLCSPSKLAVTVPAPILKENKDSFTDWSICSPRLPRRVTPKMRKNAEDKGLKFTFVTSDDKTEIDKIQKLGFTLEPNQLFLKGKTIIEADSSRIREVIDNLTTNAVKYTKTGDIWSWGAENKDFVWFYIKDTGIGIKPENQSLLFEKT